MDKTEEQLRSELAAVYASTSWRVTGPLRLASRVIRGAARLCTRPRSSLRELLRRMVRNATLRELGIKVLRPFPVLKQRIRRIVIADLQYAAVQPEGAFPQAREEAALPLAASEILAELRQAKNNKAKA